MMALQRPPLEMASEMSDDDDNDSAEGGTEAADAQHTEDGDVASIGNHLRSEVGSEGDELDLHDGSWPLPELDDSTVMEEESSVDGELQLNQDQIENQELPASFLLRYLTEEERGALRVALYSEGSLEKIMVIFGTDSVQRVSLRRLRPGKWLNDEVVHMYLALLQKRDTDLSAKDPMRKQCLFFKSFFISQLLDGAGGYNYSNVRRWSRNKIPGRDLFELGQIFVPINIKGIHWTLAVIDIEKQEIRHYDSMNGNVDRYLNGLLRYLCDEYERTRGLSLRRGDWRLINENESAPQQENSFDCGVFVCMICDFLSIGKPLVLTQDHISRCRERIAVSIMKGFIIC